MPRRPAAKAVLMSKHRLGWSVVAKGWCAQKKLHHLPYCAAIRYVVGWSLQGIFVKIFFCLL